MKMFFSERDHLERDQERDTLMRAALSGFLSTTAN